MTLTLTNPTDRELVALQVQGHDYVLAPGESMTTDDNRLALMLGEYGFTMSPADRVSAIRGDDHPSAQPVTDDEARFTGGRHHRADDIRANVPGTPVEITGDTGSPTNARAKENASEDLPTEEVLATVDTPGVPVVENEPPSRAKRRRRGHVVEPESPDASIADGTDLTVKTTPQALDAEDAPPVAPSELAAAAAAAAVTPASQATRDAIDAGAGSAPTSDAPPETETLATPTSTTPPAEAPPAEQAAATPPGGSTADTGSDLSWIDALKGAKLDDAMNEQGMDPTGKDADAKRAELRAAFSA